MAKRELITFGSNLGNKLKQMADQWTPARAAAGQMSAANSVGCWIMQATEEIPKATGICPVPGSLIGITPGAGSARVCHRDRVTGLLVPYRPNSIDVATTVYNLQKTKVKNGGYFLGIRDLNGNLWVDEIYDFCPCETDGQTLKVVTKVTFDVTSCKLVVCTRDICLPPGATIGPEQCPGSGSGGLETGSGGF